ncbi:mCG147552 [Mus musculus]|nr:mCG147552 [Mus musculus]
MSLHDNRKGTKTLTKSGPSLSPAVSLGLQSSSVSKGHEGSSVLGYICDKQKTKTTRQKRKETEKSTTQNPKCPAQNPDSRT